MVYIPSNSNVRPLSYFITVPPITYTIPNQSRSRSAFIGERMTPRLKCISCMITMTVIGIGIGCVYLLVKCSGMIQTNTCW